MFSRFFSEESVFFSLFDIKQPRIIEYFGVTQFGTFYVKNYLRNRLPDGSLTYLPVGHRLGARSGHRYLYQNEYSNNGGSICDLKYESELCNGNSFCTVQCSHRVWSPNSNWYPSPCPCPCPAM